MKKILSIILISTCIILVGCGNISKDKQLTSSIKTSIEKEVSKNSIKEEEKNKDKSKLEKNKDKLNVENDNKEKIKKENLDKDKNPIEEDKIIDNYLNSFEKASILIDNIYSNENIIFSPLSLDMALAMASEGARGDTLDELNNFLGTTTYGEFAKDYVFNNNFCIANSFWGNKNNTFNENYFNILKENYNATIDYLDFSSNESSNIINSWIEEQTNGMLREVVKPGDINESLNNVLVNTVYFERKWEEPWDVCDGVFYNLDGTTYNGEVLKSSCHTYYENDGVVGFSKSYGNGLSFIGILPREDGDFNLEDLDLEGLFSSETNMFDVNIQMPRLNVESCLKLEDVLCGMGLSKSFSSEADFTNISSQMDGIDKIIQNCKLELDENGTRASAATAIYSKNLAMIIPSETKEVILDRPFVFLIYDNNANQILFIGKIVNI